jgi:transcriptional regulator with XRE-family HTH domain
VLEISEHAYFYQGGSAMNGKFGEFIAEKRKSRGLTLRGLAAELGIVPAYMSDIEKGHRYPPDKDKLYELSRILCLSEDETNTMFDLAAGEKENTVSPDLPEYIMGNEQVRVALRMARDSDKSSEIWQKVIEMLEEQERGKK